MAHFAELNEKNIVIQVVVINNDDCKNNIGIEDEKVGIAFCQKLFGGGRWVQTSYNAKIRKNYAALYGEYREDLDAFIPPKHFSSWVLNETTANWEAPVPCPGNEFDYYWDDNKIQWVKK